MLVMFDERKSTLAMEQEIEFPTLLMSVTLQRLTLQTLEQVCKFTNTQTTSSFIISLTTYTITKARFTARFTTRQTTDMLNPDTEVMITASYRTTVIRNLNATSTNSRTMCLFSFRHIVSILFGPKVASFKKNKFCFFVLITFSQKILVFHALQDFFIPTCYPHSYALFLPTFS